MNIRRFLTLLLVMLCTMGLFIHDAEARRFGGGRSFGMQRSFSNATRMTTPQPGFTSTSPGSATSRWLGPLAGLAAGGLLGYLLMGHGIGSGILSWLLIGGAILLLINFIRNKAQPARALTPMFNDNRFAQEQATTWNRASDIHSTSGFDVNEFLRETKVQFMRLQAAYDQKNLNDIREFTTPEVYAEIQLQLQERGDATNVTEVVTLDAQLLNNTTEFQVPVASVHFSGRIRENNQDTIPFTEIWHFRQNLNTANWLVAGISQQ